MVERSQRILNGETHLIPPIPEWPAGIKKEDLDPSLLEHRFMSMVKYHKEKCLYPKCRLCMDNCPVYGIDLSVNPPVIAEPCIDCEFCAQICPTGAMDGDAFHKIMEPMTAKGIKGFLVESLGEAEKNGHFRPLVPLKKVGTDVPLYKKGKHPQWIIGKGLQV
jgi:ferredoxin